jgi:iron(III) transport system substrate-binding protein
MEIVRGSALIIRGSRLGALIACLLVATCGDADDGRLLVVHSSVSPALLEAVETRFDEAHADAGIRIVQASDSETLAALRSGDAYVDVWWGAPVTALEVAAQEGLLQRYRPPWVPETGAFEADDLWHVSLVSPFVIAFNRERVPLARAPSDWIDLFHFRWFDEVTLPDPVADPDAAYFIGTMIVETLRRGEDLTRAFDWHRRLDGQVARYETSAAEAIRRLGAGEALLAILPLHVVEAARNGDAPWLHYRVPEGGTPLLARGIAIAGSTAKLELARRFVDLTGSLDVATEVLVRSHWRHPHVEVERSRLPSDFEIEAPVTPYALAPDTLAAELDGWLERWDLEVRGRGVP